MGRAVRLGLLLGGATGIRSTAGLGVLAASPAAKGSFLAPAAVRMAVEAAVVGEVVADKLGVLPPRTDLLPLAGRAVLGGMAGAVAASWTGSSRVGAALTGAAVATATAWLATSVRREADRRGLPDVVPALAEDAVVFGLGVSALSHLT